jgi:hypothetical protein
MHPYLAGWIMSDGHNTGIYWVISQNIDDADVLYALKQRFGGVLWKQSRKPNDGAFSKKAMMHLRKNSRHDCEELVRKWGVPCGKKSRTVTFPHCGATETWVYLRGVFEGDGSISGEGPKEDHPRVQIISSRAWCDKCMVFLRRFGILSYIHDDKRHPGLSSLIIRRQNSVHDFMGRIYGRVALLYMKRKFEHWKKLKTMHPRIKDRTYLSNNELVKIRSKLLSGRTVKEMAKEYRCSPNVLWKMKRKEDGGRVLRSRKLIEEVKKLLPTGLALCKICERVGCSGKIVNKARFEIEAEQRRKQC